MMKRFATVLGLVLVLLDAAGPTRAAAANADLEWKIKVPITLFYRAVLQQASNAEHYFLDPQFIVRDWSFRRELYVHDACLSNPEPIYCSEKKLGPVRLAQMMSRLKNPEKGNSWAAEAYLANFSTYWLWYRTYHQSYLREILHEDVRAQVRLARHVRKFDGECELLSPSNAVQTLKCSDWFDIRIPRGEAQKLVIKRLSDGATFETEAVVRQITVVGLGDSFASGEGVPDIPVKLDGRPRQPSKQTIDLGPTAAQWLERNCHRSLLGPQARAVIQYAASNPHTEINFIYLPCSGAEISEGILGPYLGAYENSSHTLRMVNAGHKWLASLSQLNQVMVALCKAGNCLRSASKRRPWNPSRRCSTATYWPRSAKACTRAMKALSVMAKSMRSCSRWVAMTRDFSLQSNMLSCRG